jgi:hypothetical protein
MDWPGTQGGRRSESGQADDGGVADEQVRLNLVKGINGGVVREFVFGRILAHVDAGQPARMNGHASVPKTVRSLTSTSPKDFTDSANFVAAESGHRVRPCQASPRGPGTQIISLYFKTEPLSGGKQQARFI